MSNAKRYVIGDLQGCFASLQQLLAQLSFREGIDQIYLLGDLVNRGPQSLECLRWAMDTPGVTSVLGNHDFHLLAIAAGNQRYHKASDTLTDILQAPDRDALITWLRHRPLLIHLADIQTTLVHAGIIPQWTLAQAQAWAHAIEDVLRSDHWNQFVAQHLYGNKPSRFSKANNDIERLRFAINSFARMRMCKANGRLELKLKPSQTNPKDYAPWFSWPRVDNSCGRILFGHWSTLAQDSKNTNLNARCLDTGCLWGRQLTALCLETDTLFQVDCPRYAIPSGVRK